MHQSEIIVLLFAVVAASVLIARKIQLPYPIVLVLVGLALSFVPPLPEVKLDPNIFFYFFLPPLLAAAFALPLVLGDGRPVSRPQLHLIHHLLCDPDHAGVSRPDPPFRHSTFMFAR
jgi:hypothetical protein